MNGLTVLGLSLLALLPLVLHDLGEREAGR